MFSQLSEKTKAALFLAVGMFFFLLAGSLVYFFPKSQYVNSETNKISDSSSIEDLYQNLTETDSGNRASMVTEVSKHDSQTGIQIIKNEADNRWVLYVTGCVKNPGVYKLPEGARVFQLVEAAGGLTMVADVVAINMAAPLQDGDHLHVPQKGDDDSVRNRNRASNMGTNETVIYAGDAERNGAGVRRQRTNNRKDLPGRNIDLNTASGAELQMLPGVGPALSERIINYRSQNGRFKQVSDLINVPGIGAKKLEAIEPFVFVR